MKSKKLESHCLFIQGCGEAENDDRNNHTDDINDAIVVDAVCKGDVDIGDFDFDGVIVDDVDRHNLSSTSTLVVDDVVRSLLLIRLGTQRLSEVIYFRSWDSTLAASYLCFLLFLFVCFSFI